MKYKFKLFILSAILFFYSCLGIFDYEYNKQIADNYFIRAIDSRESMNIGFGFKDASEGLISSCVFEIQWDESYIFAKQHPWEPVNGLKKNIVNFYIIKIIKKGEGERATDNYFGPLTYEKFHEKRESLRLPNKLENIITFEDLE